MARMIPPIIAPECQSPGERELFHQLAQDPLTTEWIVLHSLDVADHRRRAAGEIDFVVIVPHKGVLCLEVKAHRQVRCDQGLWYLGNAAHPEPRSPFRQSAEAMYSIRERLAAHRPDLARIVFWSAVIFPYARVDTTSVEWHPWQLMDQRSLQRQSLSVLLEGVLDRARAFLATRPEVRWFHAESAAPTPSQCEQIATELRPNFEYFESPKGRCRRLAEELKHYTADQLVALDAMEANPRVVFCGPAGSGKTVLAVEAARRTHARGQRSLLLCFNRLLGRWLEEQTQPLRPSVTVSTLHRYLLEVAGMRSLPPSPAEDFWQHELPQRAIDRLLEAQGEDHLYDELLVDEAQDLLSEAYLDVLDLSLKGGLAAGRWRLFGDFEKQAIYAAADISLEDFLHTRGTGAPIYQLRINCRNTPRTAALVRLLGGLEPDYLKILRPDNQVDAELRYYQDASDQQQQLISVLAKLYDQDLTAQEIVVLSPRADGACASQVRTSPWRDRLRPMEQVGPGLVGYSSIQAFKGLEAPVVIVTDFERFAPDRMQALFYVAVTRATQRLVIFAHEQAKAEILTAFAGGAGS